MGPVADPQVLGVVAPHPEVLELLEQRAGLEDDAVPDHVQRRGPEDPGGDEVERVLLFAHEHSVACVRAPVEPDDDVGGFGKVVDYLALALVAKLAPQNHYSRHYERPRRPSLRLRRVSKTHKTAANAA